MKRVLSFVTAAGLVMVAVAAFAAGTGGGKPGTWKGEVLDAGCYLGHGAMGAKHKECALKCVSNGMPMMLMGADGKAILLTPNHDDADAYNKLKTMAGSMVEVTGTLSERGGIRGIDVTGAKLLAGK